MSLVQPRVKACSEWKNLRENHHHGHEQRDTHNLLLSVQHLDTRNQFTASIFMISMFRRTENGANQAVKKGERNDENVVFGCVCVCVRLLFVHLVICVDGIKIDLCAWNTILRCSDSGNRSTTNVEAKKNTYTFFMNKSYRYILVGCQTTFLGRAKKKTPIHIFGTISQ